MGLKLGKDKLVDMYTMMLIIRRFEEKVSELFYRGELPGAAHLYIGEEAVAIGTCANLRADDRITSTHRGHGHLIAKGGKLKDMFAELYGREAGCCRGKGGSMHIADFKVGDIGAMGVVGGGLPVATGSALAAKLQGTDQVTVCFFGDGAVNQGTFHESINLAAIWNLPVIYVCENNVYALWSPYWRMVAGKSITNRARAYGIPGVVVDGNDVVAVFEAVRKAVERARTGKGPSLVECQTYRWHGHNEGEEAILGDRHYRTKEEIEDWKRKDPVTSFEKKLLEEGILTRDDISRIDSRIRSELDDAIAYAKGNPFPAPEEALEDVFSD